MKKFYDIKVRRKRVLVPPDLKEPGHFDDFWQGHGFQPQEGPRPPRKDRAGVSKIIMVCAFLVSFTMLALGRVYVVKADMEFDANSAKENINKAISNLSAGDFDGAYQEGNEARNKINKIKINLQSWGQNSQYLKLIGYRSDLVTMETLIDSLDKILDITTQSKNIIESTTNELSAPANSTLEAPSIKVNLTAVNDYLTNYQKQISEVSDEIKKISDSNTFISQEEIAVINAGVTKISSNIEMVQRQYIPLLQWFLADGHERNIMLLFQNNAELRASGGFIGSYAVIHTKNSQIAKIDFQTNIYKLDNAADVPTDATLPPEFKILTGGKLYLRDANFAVDGPESFAKVLNLYKTESGQSLDGVVAVDTTLVTQLLSIVGPIDMPQYQIKIDNNNFLKAITTEVEQTYFTRNGAVQENEPKKVLSEMMPLLLNKVFSGLKDSHNRSKITKVFSGSLSSKHILFYARDQEVQKIISNLNLGAGVANGNYDYFFSHSTNIGGAKSSLNIIENVNDQIDISNDGVINHQVTIERQHSGNGAWPDYTNVNLMRILMPTGSNLTDFKALKGNFYAHFDKQYEKDADHYLGQEAGKDKLTFWMNTAPQTTSEASFSYASGYKIDTAANSKDYKLYLQKEAGTPDYWYTLTINYPNNWHLKNSLVNSTLQYRILLNRDKLLDIEFE